jgi:hypothetical protein
MRPENRTAGQRWDAPNIVVFPPVRSPGRLMHDAYARMAGHSCRRDAAKYLLQHC